MAGRCISSAFLLFVVLSGTARAELSSEEKEMVKRLTSVGLNTYSQKSFSQSTGVRSHTTVDSDGSSVIYGVAIAQVLARVSKPKSVDFYGKVKLSQFSLPGEGTMEDGAEVVVVGDNVWAKKQGETSWTEPDFDDDDNEDLLDAFNSFKEESIGVETMKYFSAENVERIELTKAPTKAESCYRILPTREFLFEDADDFFRQAVEHGQYHTTACVDDTTGFLSSLSFSLEAKDFSVTDDGDQLQVKHTTVDLKRTYSKFGEPVDFPDVSSPTATRANFPRHHLKSTFFSS
ncbi:hypothetical protein BSKO_05677 [Bryopsis sp. KO-2023]|nr:hypothetical protein BSKO_05677 [Bryopsis sp. KO-2023]